MGKDNGHQGSERVNGWDGDPTVPPPAFIGPYGPAPAYAVIHTNNYISPHTPINPNLPPPGGIYIFHGHLRTFVFAFKLGACLNFEVGMPDKHQLVLDFIKAYIRLHGVAPSYSVIARGLNMRSKSNIHRIIHKLKDEGLVAVKPYQFNSIRVIDRSVREVASL